MNELQHDWVRARATNFESCLPDAKLTDDERVALARIVGDAPVIALGEAVHGSKEIIHSRERVLRFLIQERKASVIVLEACFTATQSLNRYVLHGDGSAEEATVAIGYWTYANQETLGFAIWLRDYNHSLPGTNRPVRVYGCDVQSVDGPKAELARLSHELGGAARIPQETIAELTSLLASLPKDGDVSRCVEAIVIEATSTNPNQTRISDMQAQLAALTATARLIVEKLSSQFQALQLALPPTVADDDRFLLKWYWRLLEQTIEFYSPGGLEKRDQFMAENVIALREHFQQETIVLLSHNLHISRAPMSIRGQQFVPMGSLLATQLGDNYRALGSAFYGGKYLAAGGNSPEQDEVVVANTPGPLAFEQVLQRVVDERQTPGLLVDFSKLVTEEDELPWPSGLEMRIGEAGSQGDYEASFMRQRPELQYDGMIILKETSPITVLPGYYAMCK